MSALDELNEIDLEKITPLEAAVVFLSHKYEGDAAIAAAELLALREELSTAKASLELSECELRLIKSELADAKARAKKAEEGWHANEARNAKLVEAIKAAQIQLHATQRNWDEECLFRCNDIMKAALEGKA